MELTFVVTSQIVSRQYLSDHNLIIIDCTPTHLSKNPSPCKMNCEQIKDPRLKGKMLLLLSNEILALQRKKAPLDKQLEKCLKKASNLAKSWGKQEAMAKAMKEKVLWALFTKAQLALEGDSQYLSLHGQLEECKDNLKKMDDSKI